MSGVVEVQMQQEFIISMLGVYAILPMALLF